MLITRRDPFTGKMVSREIDVNPEQIAAWQAGTKIQEAMPNVPAHEREFIMTGITPEKWARIRGIHEPPAPHIVEDWEEE